MSQGSSDTDVDAVVIGAGFGGLYMLYKLRELGLSTQVFEAGDGVGGTWYWNRYPGARCDVESLAYSYSFDPELEQDWEWSERYPAQPEIEKYLNHVADRYDLRRDIALETRVTAATFDEDTTSWTIETDTGRSVTCRWLITAVGCLSKPKEIDIEGKGSFAGPTYHTPSWPKDGVDFSGKRVAVIGTGSTGIQVIPEIAKQAEHLTVFQRTPNFSLPAQNRDLTGDEIEEFKADYRHFREEQRASAYGVPAPPPEPSALAVAAEERNRKYQQAWDKGGFAEFFPYADLLTDIEANETVAQFVRDKIAGIVDDPELAAKLAPTDYAFGTKRPCLDTRYFETYNRDNVTLVDLRETPLERITGKGIETSDRSYEVDAIVFATGFDAMVGALNAIDIRGRGGALLRDEWKNGPVTYLGLSVAGFPNMFTITGPLSPSVFSNMIVSIEQHVEWIADCVAYVDKAGEAGIEATSTAQDDWVSHVSELADMTLFPQTDSWYVGANVPGKPRVFMPYVGGVGFYRETCDEIVRDDYRGFDLISAPQEA
ncbi:MAG: NAD(P)/FAD-dependent oxidoreductase [Acidimicrobiales bacterium]